MFLIEKFDINEGLSIMLRDLKNDIKYTYNLISKILKDNKE